MIVQDIIDTVEFTLNDVGQVTYTSPELIEYCNDAQSAICNIRPDAYVTTENLTVVQDSIKQSLPSGAKRLVRLIRNMGGGSTPGRGIRGPIIREDLDSYFAGASGSWNDDSGEQVLEYMYDEENPLYYYVYPAQDTNELVEAQVARDPVKLTATTGTFSIGDEYRAAVVTYVVSRALSKDSDNSPNYARGKSFMQEFMTMIGAKTSSDLAVSPNNTEKANG